MNDFLYVHGTGTVHLWGLKSDPNQLMHSGTFFTKHFSRQGHERGR